MRHNFNGLIMKLNFSFNYHHPPQNADQEDFTDEFYQTFKMN